MARLTARPTVLVPVVLFTTMDDIRARLAAVDKVVSGEHFKKVCSVTVDVSLAKLASSQREQTARLEEIIYNAQSQMNSIIFKHGVASNN